VVDQDPTESLARAPQPGRRRTVLLKIAPQPSFPRRRESTVPTMGPRSPAFAEDKFRGADVDFQNRRNKARMYMKTKNKDKMSLHSSAPDAIPAARLAPRAERQRLIAWSGSSPLGMRDSAKESLKTSL